jgi:hypothetical protein
MVASRQSFCFRRLSAEGDLPYPALVDGGPWDKLDGDDERHSEG